MPPLRPLASALTLTAALGLALLPPQVADAMCTCMMRPRPPRPRPPSEQSILLSRATRAVMMRDGTRTVLAFQNDYVGPPEDFALLVPVPSLLREDDVRTLPHDVFRRLEAVAAPRMIELWEQPPCPQRTPTTRRRRSIGALDAVGASASGRQERAAAGADDVRVQPVRVEARFSEAEYDITILGADDSFALERWLRAHDYELPPGAGAVLRPYVQQGMKFFVAKVDASRLRRGVGPQMLSPLRFHFDSETFRLPVRLGLLNSDGLQDLVVHVLAPDTRYEAANYPNAVAPTNLPLHPAAAPHFERVYDAFFDKLRAHRPGTVVTEYAGPVSGLRPPRPCLGCDRPGLSERDLDLLGADVLPSRVAGGLARRMVLTRLHYRYGRSALPDDLVFRPAPAIRGGHENAAAPELATRARRARGNRFGVRFIAKHRWRAPTTCRSPRQNVWGGRPWGPFPDAPPEALPPGAHVPLDRWIEGRVPAIGLR